MAAPGNRGREFAVVPPPAHAGLLLAALLAVAAVALLVAFLKESASGQSQAWSIVGSLAILAAVSLLAFVSLLRRRVSLEEGRLRVQAGIFAQTVAAADLDLVRARVLDLAERTELRPAIRTWGMSMPGYHAGHFRLRRSLGKAFCLVTDRQRVLWLPRRQGNAQLLLSVEQPQLLLDALRAAQA